MDGEELLLYGSYGYTGSLVAAAAVNRGLSPTLAGRRAGPVEEQATALDLDHRVFSLAHPEVVERQVADADAVLSCAGPFSATAEPLVDACLATGTSYLDIAGEVDVLEAIAERDRDAEAADVTLLPAVGYDVVPTDCLAAQLEMALPSATRLSLAIDGLGTFSPGTVKSIVEGLDEPGLVREDGALRSVPAAWKVRRVDFGEGAKPAVTIPWGDVSSAYYTTGIPNVEVYAAVPGYAVRVMRGTRWMGGVLGSEPVQWALARAADAVVSGPTPAERARSSTRIWGEATDDDGNRTTARLRTPDTYELTAETAVESARRVLAGEVEPGFQTPASAFGHEFALEFDGVERVDGREAPAPAAGGE